MIFVIWSYRFALSVFFPLEFKSINVSIRRDPKTNRLSRPAGLLPSDPPLAIAEGLAIKWPSPVPRDRCGQR